MYKNLNKNFTLLLIGQFVSLLGDRISSIVFFTIVVAIVGNESSLWASFIVAVQMAPLFLFGYIFGLAADKISKKGIMLFADLIRALLVLLLIPFQDSLLAVYLIVFAIGVMSSMFDPSKKSILPFIVSQDKIIKYNKIFVFTEFIAMAVGLGFGTLLIKTFSIETALIIDAFTYLFSFFMILFITYKYEKKVIDESVNSKIEKLKAHIDDLKEGLKYIKGENNVKHVILNISLVHFFSAGVYYSSISDFSVKFASNSQESGSFFGYALLSVALGALTTPLTFRYLKRLKDSTISQYVFLIAGGVLVVAIGFVALGFESLWMLLFAMYLSGIGVGLQYVRILYLIHTYSKKEYMGRVVSLNEIGSSLAVVLGILVGGFLNDWLDYRYGYLLSGLLYMSGFIYFKMIKHKIVW